MKALSTGLPGRMNCKRTRPCAPMNRVHDCRTRGRCQPRSSPGNVDSSRQLPGPTQRVFWSDSALDCAKTFARRVIDDVEDPEGSRVKLQTTHNYRGTGGRNRSWNCVLGGNA
jgi:hypothetical protein